MWFLFNPLFQYHTKATASYFEEEQTEGERELEFLPLRLQISAGGFACIPTKQLGSSKHPKPS